MRRLLRRLRAAMAARPVQTTPLLAPRFPQYAIGPGSYGELEVIDHGEGMTLTIGAYCSFAADVKIMLGGGHRTDWVTTYPFSVFDPELGHIAGHPVSRGDVTIGSDVWIGREALILSGVEIGHGAVIGARAVVTRDVPPYAIVAGVPARVVRSRFDADLIARLLACRWWDWDAERIRKAGPLLLSNDVAHFLELVEAGRI